MSDREAENATRRTSLVQCLNLDFPFSPSFLCTGVILIWIQCILYARYIHVDGGTTTIAINFSRCAFIVIACAIALYRGFSPKAQQYLGQISIGLMTVASFMLFLQSTEPNMNLTLLASIFAGAGLAWGGGQCINLYVRLGMREAVLYTFLSMAFSALIGIAIAFVPEYIAYFISMLLPVTALIMYDRATKNLNARDAVRGSSHTPQADDLYGKEPRSTWIRLAFGIALFSFVLGASRGFPYGSSIELPPVFQIVQFLGVIAACLFLIRHVLIEQRGLRFSMLWQTQLFALSLGVILLATFDDFAISLGATLIAITNLFQVAFLWFLSYDFARHRKLPSYIILGAFWFLHLFFRETGRLTMLSLGPSQSIGATVLVAIMICLLATSMGFLLTDDIPRIRPLFSDLEPRGTKRAETIEKNSARMLDEAAVEEEKQQVIVTYLKAKFHLTQREAEISVLLSQGRSTTYIAATLFLSDNTVRSYVKNIYAKMDIHSKQDFIDYMRSQKF